MQDNPIPISAIVHINDKPKDGSARWRIEGEFVGVIQDLELLGAEEEQKSFNDGSLSSTNELAQQ